MSPDVLSSMIIGAGLLGAGALSGIIGAALLRSGAPREPSPYTCGCTHALAVHDPETNRCNATVNVKRWHEERCTYITVGQPCACRQYIGERPVDVEAVLDDFVRKHPTLPAADEGRT